MDNANSAKTILDESIKDAANTNETLTETDDKAKSTETLIKNLMNQLEKTKDEVRQIIASGDLSKYVTDPKLQEVLKDYLSKNELNTSLDEKIDKTAITDDFQQQSQEKVLSQKGVYDLYAAFTETYGELANSLNEQYQLKADKREIPTKLSQLTNDENFKTEAEIQSMIEKASSLKKEVVTSLPTAGKDDVIYLVKDTKGKDNNNYLEYLWLSGKYELIGSTQVDLSGYAQLTDITASKVISIYELDKDFRDALQNDQDFLTAIKRDMLTLVAFKGNSAEDLMVKAGFETILYYKGQPVGAVDIVGSTYIGMDKTIREDKMPKENSLINWTALATYNSTIQAQLKEQKDSSLNKTDDKAIAPQDSNPNSSVWQDDNKYVTPKFLSTYVDLEISGRDETIQAMLGSKLGTTDIQEFTQQELEEAFK